MNVIDCFTFFNELDLLEIRLHELSSVVDCFVLVEAELKQTLAPKPLYFEDNKERFSDFLSKIVHIKVSTEDCAENAPNTWQMENFQRNCIRRGLDKIGLVGSDLVMISDLDEIPKSESVVSVKKYYESGYSGKIAFDMSFHSYFLNLIGIDKGWVGTVMVPFADLFSIQSIRDNKDRFTRTKNAGWHFSWLGGEKKVYEKYFSCIEPMDKSKIPSFGEFQVIFRKAINEGNFIYIDQNDKFGDKLQRIEINDTFPKYLVDNQEKFGQYILR